MGRRALIGVVTAAAVAGCNSILGIDGDVLGPEGAAGPDATSPEASGPGDATESDTSTTSREDAGDAGRDRDLFVFVTSEKIRGDIGGLEPADRFCQGLADGAKLGGAYKAWLSVGTQNPQTRFTRSSRPYVLPNPARTTVVGSLELLFTTGKPMVAINATEKGTPMGGTDNYALTNTKGNGTTSSSDCGGFMTLSGSTYHGAIEPQGSLDVWSETPFAGGCSKQARLYCFEQ